MDLQLRDAAKLLHISEATLRGWIAKRNVPAYRVGGKFRFGREQLLEWATKNGVQLSPDTVSSDTSIGVPIIANIGEALDLGGIFHEVPGIDKRTVLEAVVERLHLPLGADRAFILQILLAREALGSTGVGEGIAIPHTRDPIVLNMPAPIVSLCFLKTPIDFEAIDGQPVSVIFTLLSPSVKLHLHLISRLAFLLHDAGLRACLASRAEGPTIISQIRRLEQALAQKSREGRLT